MLDLLLPVYYKELDLQNSQTEELGRAGVVWGRGAGPLADPKGVAFPLSAHQLRGPLNPGAEGILWRSH